MARSRFIAVFSSTPSRLYRSAHMVSPRAEVRPPDGLIFEVPARLEQETLNRISSLADGGLQIGSASTRTLAVFVAKIRPGTILPYGRERDFLATLPIHFLSLQVPLEDSLLETLKRWGIKTLGDLAALPEPALVARLGQGGALLQKIARGEEAEFLQSLRPPEEFRASQELEWPVESLETLSFILGGLLKKVCSRLKRRGLAAEKIHLDLKLDRHASYTAGITPALPMRTPRVILSLLRLELQGNPPPAPVVGITIRMIPAEPRILQESLFEPAALHPEKLSKTLARLAAVVGGGNIGTPKLLDTHRPDAVKLKQFHVSRENRPVESRRQKAEWKSRPGEAFSTATVNYPVTQLSLRRLRPPRPFPIRLDRVISCAGPWKSSGDWWRGPEEAESWSREEWDIEMTDGSLYRIFWDHRAKNWFLEGVYD